MLAELLLEQGYEVLGMVRRRAADYPNLEGIRDRVTLVGQAAFPHAANGKLQRLAARSAYERGELSS